MCNAIKANQVDLYDIVIDFRALVCVFTTPKRKTKDMDQDPRSRDYR